MFNSSVIPSNHCQSIPRLPLKVSQIGNQVLDSLEQEIYSKSSYDFQHQVSQHISYKETKHKGSTICIKQTKHVYMNSKYLQPKNYSTIDQTIITNLESIF